MPFNVFNHYVLKVITVFLIVCLNDRIMIAKIIEGELDTKENWVFLARFCFLSHVGQFNYEVTYPKEYEPQKLLLYFDADQLWPSIYKSGKNCEEKEGVLKIDHHQIINLTEFSRVHLATHASGCKSAIIDGIPSYNCSHYRKFSSARERWWFIAVDNCDSTKGLRLKYKITMINNPDNPWFKHFSADEFYILHTDVFFCVLYYLLFLASCYAAYVLYSRHLFHVTYKMYLISLLCESFGLTFLCIYYGIYSNEGNSPNAIKLIGKAFEAVSTLVFLLLLILLAKGFTVTRARLKPSTSAKIGIFMSVYTIIYVSLFIYEQQFFDPGEVLYIYESPSGYGLIALRLIGWAWFVYAIVFTLIHYPGKSTFFTRLFLIYSIWFISAPLVILISTFVVPKWMREKIINLVELFIAMEAHFAFFVYTRPSAANRNFPFHVRTTQIAVMSKTGPTGDGTLDHFSHYQYAPTRPQTQQSGINNTIFSVSNGVSHANNNDDSRGRNNFADNTNGTLPAADC